MKRAGLKAQQLKPLREGDAGDSKGEVGATPKLDEMS